MKKDTPNQGFDAKRYAMTYLALYRANRQEAMDYAVQLRKLLSREQALEAIQLAAECSIEAYRKGIIEIDQP